MRDLEPDGPNRTCIATRQVLPVEALIRFVASPEGVVTPDIRRKLPGRGVWVMATENAVADAVKKKAFARGLKSPVKAPDDLILIPGCIDSTTNFVEHPELVAQRLANYVRAVGKERVIAGTDCGFSTFAGFGVVEPAITWAKASFLA